MFRWRTLLLLALAAACFGAAGLQAAPPHGGNGWLPAYGGHLSGPSHGPVHGGYYPLPPANWGWGGGGWYTPYVIPPPPGAWIYSPHDLRYSRAMIDGPPPNPYALPRGGIGPLPPGVYGPSPPSFTIPAAPPSRYYW